ncbi:MAG: helix-turn-helix transcriptional regulator [Candidatus Avoscillospira sp.]
MLGRRIGELRVAFGWSQVDLAKRLSVTKQTVSNWENGNIQPSVEMLVRLAQIFRVTTDYLLGFEEVPRLDTQGLSLSATAHLALLIDDLRQSESTTSILRD